MQSIELIRDNLTKSTDRVLAGIDDVLGKCREMRALTVELLDSLSETDLDNVSGNAPKGYEETFGTYRLCLQYVADHWYVHRGQLADARRAAGIERMWL